MNKQHKFRTKLQNRSIQPSEGSWEQLIKQLDAHENHQKRKKWDFIKYAAAILIIVSVGFYFFQPKTEIISEEKTENSVTKEQIESEPVMNSKNEILVADAEEITTPIKPKEVNKSIENKLKTIEPLIIAEDEIAENKSISNEIETKSTTNSVANSEVTDTEIEQLLMNAKIKVNHQNFTKKSVSAQALLLEVEDDLDKDFKEKLIENIVKTIKTPRTIVITDRGDKN
jgi:mannitol-specific phosphotransferase system IIBC component